MSYDFEVSPVNAGHDIYEKNVTYNLSTMLKRAGFHPKVLNGLTVEVLRRPVQDAMLVLANNPAYFVQFAPANGWGTVDTARSFLQGLHKYLKDAPDEYTLKVM